jgi:hypothetical protein
VVGEEAGEEVHIFLVSSISSKVPAIVIVFWKKSHILAR